MTVNYYINGISFASYGVKVSASSGILDALKLKKPQVYAWPDQHGEVLDLAAPRYESRSISLDCYIKASSSTAFILAVQSFLAAFQKSGLQRLMIDVNDDVVTRKPLLYEIYLAEEVEISKRWKSSTMIGTFTIKLTEPEPVKRVYKFVSAPGDDEVSVQLTSTEPINIYWGDGGSNFDVVTSSGEVVHNYAASGTYYILLTGVIDSISALTTNATLVWTRL
jgi:hypothetical protein